MPDEEEFKEHFDGIYDKCNFTVSPAHLPETWIIIK